MAEPDDDLVERDRVMVCGKCGAVVTVPRCTYRKAVMVMIYRHTCPDSPPPPDPSSS